jgi:hypothetical protein
MVDCGERLEAAALVAPRDELRQGKGEREVTSLRIEFRDANDTILIRDHWVEQDGFDNGKQCRDGANPEAEREDRDCRDEIAAPEAPNGVPHVLPENVHETHEHTRIRPFRGHSTSCT